MHENICPGDNDDAPVIEDDESMEGMGGLQQQSAIVASSQVDRFIEISIHTYRQTGRK